ncbi:hypothetical protein NBRC116597_24890 [Phaeobacter sp. NW0010-22]
MIEKNWALHVEMPKPQTGQRHQRWGDEHIQVFRKQWATDKPQRLTMELMLFTGMRICDAVRCGPRWVECDGWIKFKQKKTKGDVLFSFNRDLAEFVDNEAHEFLE